MINSIWVNEPGDCGREEGCTVEEKRGFLDENMTEGGFVDPRFLFATLDGKPLAFQTPWVRATSPTFRIRVGENDPFFPPGTADDEAVSDGYWLLVQPLSPGEHELAFGGQIFVDLDGDDAAETSLFEVNVVYHLTVTGDGDDDD